MHFNKIITYASKLIGLIIITFLFQSYVIAQEPGFGIEPTRVVLEAGAKSSSITINNTSSATIAYRLSLVEMGLAKNGEFRQLESHELHPNHLSAKQVVRFSPRQIRLKPGEKQVVRVIAKRNRSLAAGEYRSHLQIKALPVLSENILQEFQHSDDVGIVSANSGTSVGFTIPIIVRHGKTDTNVKLENIKLFADQKDNMLAAQVTMSLSGNRSALGHIGVQIQNGNQWKEIGLLKGFALYSPYPEETFAIRLYDGLTAADVNAGKKARIVFVNTEHGKNQPEKWLDVLAVPSITRVER